MKQPGEQLKPWYREPWPWVAIAIPAAAVVMGITTLVLAISNPDPLTVDPRTYRELRSELTADQAREAEESEPDSTADPNDGEH